MLEYDEWSVPGEVEYAKGKAAEIEAQLKSYHRDYEKSYEYEERSMRIQLTEHVVGVFAIKFPTHTWLDYDITDEMLINYFIAKGGFIDEPKIFDLPDDDIRNSLPEWDGALLPDDAGRDIMEMHSIRYMAAGAIKKMDGDYYTITREFNFSDAKCSRIMEAFTKKLDIENKPVAFTELEQKIADYIKCDGYYWKHYSYFHDNYYEPWYFPLAMSEKDIIGIIHEAYLSAGKRSRRIIPGRLDHANIDGWSRQWGGRRIENYECLYQGKAGNMVIRFLFDFKDMKIVTAYPVYKHIRKLNKYGYYYEEADDIYVVPNCIT